MYFCFYRSLLLLSLAILCLWNCDYPEKTRKQIDLQEIEIEIVDTLMVDYQGLLKVVLFDDDKREYLAIDNARNNSVILSFDDRGNITNIFDNSMAGDNAFKGQVRGITIDPEKHTYWVLTDNGLYEYAENWTIISFVPNPDIRPKQLNPRLNLAQHTFEGENFFFGILNPPSTRYRLNQIEFFSEAKNFTLISPKKETFETIIGFELESNYIKDRILYPPYVSLFDSRKDMNELYVGYPNELQLLKYRWNGPDISFEQYIPLDLDYFDAETANYSSTSIADDYKITLDSNVEKILTVGDKVFVCYRHFMNHKLFARKGLQYDGGNDYNSFLEEHYRQCLHILDHDKKWAKDLVLPPYLTSPILAFSETEVLMGVPRFRYEFDKEVFFKVKLKQKQP